MKSLKDKWKAFFALTFDPWNLLLCIAVGSLFYLSIGENDRLNSSLSYILITITSAILGGRISQQWSSISETGVLVARGKSAVRGLKLLLQNVATLEGRIRSFSINSNEIENNPQVVKRNYEEAIAICGLLQEETVSSIENWTDIVPDADIKSQIGEISKLKTQIHDREDELQQLEKEVANIKGKTEKEQETLRNQIHDKERQIRTMEYDLIKAKVNIGGVSGVLRSNEGIGISSLLGGYKILKGDSDAIIGNDGVVIKAKDKSK